MKFQANFNKEPVIPVRGREKDCVTGWGEIENEIKISISKLTGARKVIVVETYQGVDYDELL